MAPDPSVDRYRRSPRPRSGDVVGEALDDTVSITTSIDGVLRSLKGPDRRRVGGLFGRWDELVGPAVAAHVRPVRLDGTTLTVEVDDPSWATQLTLLTDQLRARLATADVTVERLEVRVAHGDKPRR